MKNKDSLYFDIWRKASFRNLLRAYVKSYSENQSPVAAFGDCLDRYVDGGRGAYGGSGSDWGTAYTISREFAVYCELDGGGHKLSAIADDLLYSRITASQYLANYLLNLNLLINGRVVHPLLEVMKLLRIRGEVTLEEITAIPAFSMKGKPVVYVRVFCNRIEESEILESVPSRGSFKIGKYDLEKVIERARPWMGTLKDFESMDYNGYVAMISFPNPLLYPKPEGRVE